MQFSGEKEQPQTSRLLYSQLQSQQLCSQLQFQLLAPTDNEEDLPAVEPADGIATADVSILAPAISGIVIAPILSDWPLGMGALATATEFSYPCMAFPSHFLYPPQFGAVITLLVSCFADEE